MVEPDAAVKIARAPEDAALPEVPISCSGITLSDG